jgi:hypothetical protein
MNGSLATVLAVLAGLLIGLALTALQLAAALPDPGDPSFPTITAVLGGFLAIARVRIRGGSWRRAEREAFRWGFYATGLGVLVYLFGLISNLY